jgi:hypothetical protein
MPVNLPVQQVGAALAHAAAQYHIPVSIMVGVYGQETAYGTLDSSGQYMGPFQFGSAARGMYGYPATNSPNIQQFVQQANAAAHYLSSNFQKYGNNWDVALRQYSGEPLSGPLGPGGYGLSQIQMRAQNAPHALLQASQAGGGVALPSGGAAPGMAPQASQGTQLGQQQPSFQANPAPTIAGNFLRAASGPSNPWNEGPKGANLGPNPLTAAGGPLSAAAGQAAMQNPAKVVQQAQNTLQQLAGNTPLNVHPNAAPGYKGYVNPLQGFSLGRTDMGVDANAAPGTPIRAIGDSKLVQTLPNWYSGQPLLLFQFLNGPKAGQYWYVSEQISPKTTQVGTVFHAGDPVATYASSGTGIEIGFGSPSSNSRTLAGQQGNTGGSGHSNSPAGIQFRQFLNSLGAH